MLSLGLRDPKAWKSAAIHALASGTTTTDHAASAENRQRTDKRVRIDAWIGRILLLQIVVLIVGLLIAPRPAEAAPSRPAPTRGTVAYCKRHAVDIARRACIIRVVFAPIGMASTALRVAHCESGLDPRARNGEFRGMFQVSAAWRRDVRGFGPLPEQQAWHARGVVLHPEGGWSHWSCR